MRKQFILYDGRAAMGDTDSASIMQCASSEKEARRDGKQLWNGYDAVWYEYDVAADGVTLMNETPRFDIPPQRR